MPLSLLPSFVRDVTLVLHLAGNDDIKFYSNNWNKSAHCPGTQGVTGRRHWDATFTRRPRKAVVLFFFFYFLFSSFSLPSLLVLFLSFGLCS